MQNNQIYAIIKQKIQKNLTTFEKKNSFSSNLDLVQFSPFMKLFCPNLKKTAI